MQNDTEELAHRISRENLLFKETRKHIVLVVGTKTRKNINVLNKTPRESDTRITRKSSRFSR